MAGKSGDWLKVRLSPGETAMAAMAAVLWMSLIGLIIASRGMISLASAAFGVELTGLTVALSALGNVTIRYWLLSVPLWGCAFLVSMLWGLSLPEKRQVRLCSLVFALAMGLLVVMIATYIPFAQAAGAIAHPSPNAR